MCSLIRTLKHQGSQFGRTFLLIGWSRDVGQNSAPQAEAADASVRADDKPHVTDGTVQNQLSFTKHVSVMGAELQEDRKSHDVQTMCESDIRYTTN